MTPVQGRNLLDINTDLFTRKRRGSRRRQQ